MEQVRKGEYLSCEVCGLVLVVDEACGCAAAEILCCETAMVMGKPVASKKPPAKAAKAKAKPPAKSKSPVKAASKAAPKAKKPARAKK